MGLKELICKRKDILFAEIGALIHDLGKLSKEFVEGKDDNEEKDKDNVKKFRHEKIWIDLDLIVTDYNRNQFLRRLLELILKKEPLKRINQLNNKISNLSNKPKLTINDLPQWAKNDLALKNLKEFSKEHLQDFLNKLLENTAFLKYFYIKDSFFRLKESLLKNTYEIKVDDWPIALLPIQHHRNDKKAWGYDKSNLPDKVKLILAPDGADGIDSAIDKMVSEDCKYVKQPTIHIYISTAFGYESEKIDLNLDESNEKSLTKIRENYADKLATILTNLKNLPNTPPDIPQWIEKRDELFRETKKAFLNALGETRRPANDVTLWDHSFSVASLYKAALAEVVITEKRKDPKDIKWKLLSIRFDGDKFYYTVPKIADVLGRKNLVGKILDNIKNLLEVVIPIGNEIYRDGNGSVFLVPECLGKDSILEISEIWDDDINIKDIEFKNVALNFKGERENKKLEKMTNKPNNLKELIKNVSSFMSEGIFFPEIYLSEPSRGALNLGKEISKKTKHKFDIEKLKQKWIGKENGNGNGYEKCTACGLKPVPLSYKKKKELDEKIKKEGWKSLREKEKNQYKAYERKICLDCLKSAQNRVEEWYRNTTWNKETPEKPSFDTSIWLDEIADENNRIALVYLSFDLKKWLNGEMLNTFLSKPLLDNEFKKNFENELINISNYNQLIGLIKEAFDKNDFNKDLSVNDKNGNKLKVTTLFKKVLGCYVKPGQNPEDVFNSIVTERESDWENKYPCPPCATKGNNYHKAVVFLLHLTRKHPSFARLRRIWETTRNFGIDIFEKAKSKLNPRERVIINFDFNDSLQITHTYWFKDKNKRSFELVVIEDKNKAAIISNSKDIEIPKSKRLDLYNENFKTYITTLTNVTVQKKEKYYPLIPYQFEPSKTLFFMPLKDVWEVMQLIKKEYEIQFNKVQNRLPINIGFVAFHKRTPMYAVLDAAKRMYSKKKKEPEKFKVCSIYEMDAQKNCRLYEGKIGNRVKEIRLENGYEYHFSYSTGDPEKEDLFHPYFIVENNNGWKTYVEGNWKTIKHVKYLEKEDEISFYPSYFDFLWLDTNTRRLDVGEERIHWLFKEFSPKPYNLKDIESFERLRILLLEKLKLTASQLLNIYGLLISKLEEWQLPNKRLPIYDNVFEGFVGNTILSNPLRLKISDNTEKGKITQNDFEFLKTTILNGMFFDFIDMWHTILKRKFRED